MERVLGQLSAKKLDEELELMVFRPLHLVDTDVASRAGLNLKNKAERYYCRVLQGQAVLDDLNRLVISASKFYTTSLTSPQRTVDAFAAIMTVSKN